MAIRIIITLHAVAGKGAELAEAFRGRCAEVMQEPGCEQFEVFQSVVDADKLVLLEHWADEAALEAHRQVNATRSPLPSGLRTGPVEREDYQYSQTG